MRPSTSSLLRIRPVPAAQLDVHTVRLPASQRPRRAAKPSASSASSSTAPSSSSSPASSPAQARARAPLQKRAEQTIAEQLLKKEEQSRAAAVAATGSVQSAGAESWPSNLRVVKHVNKRDVYWKVSCRDSKRESRPRRRSVGQVELTFLACLAFRYQLLNETS